AEADVIDDGEDADDVIDDGEDIIEDADVPEFTPTCNAGTRWTAGTSFQDVTMEWGLIGVVGTSINVADIDGDGWPDVLVRNGAGPDNFRVEAERRRWLLRNTGEGSLEDVTQDSGLLASRTDPSPDVGRVGDIMASGDVDNDGDLDVFVGAGKLTMEGETSELMLNNGDGTYSLGPAESHARFETIQSKPLGATFVDFDRDGFLDLWVTHNDNWSSIDSINRAEAHSWAWSSLACDLNDDGMPELLASSYGRAPNHLWRATATGYVNESVASGYAFDHRDDWGLDLNAQCFCEDNPTEEDCDTAPTPADYSVCTALFAGFGGAYRWDHGYGREPYRLGGNSGTTVCADVDNDGDFDLLTGEIVHWDVGPPSDPTELMINTGDPLVRFDRPGNDVTGLVRDHPPNWNDGDMKNAILDFDSDGWPDVYIGSSDYPGCKALLFHQSSPLSFELLPVEDYFMAYRAHGVAIADFDRDGDLDMMIGHSRMRCSGYGSIECNETSQVRLLLNTMGDESNWIQLRLEGVEANRSAIGARVEVTAGGVTQTQQVDGGHGQGGIQHDLTLHFGLGAECEADVTIRWPDSDLTTQTFHVFSSARYHVLQGGDPVYEPAF
ncbi:MAG: CRTAC1 family protein, partial [Deltaproteobacteria bacterium]|nr:CRTAC1 family protein [Deltaproteobacteria bacterium]